MGLASGARVRLANNGPVTTIKNASPSSINRNNLFHVRFSRVYALAVFLLSAAAPLLSLEGANCKSTHPEFWRITMQTWREANLLNKPVDASSINIRIHRHWWDVLANLFLCGAQECTEFYSTHKRKHSSIHTSQATFAREGSCFGKSWLCGLDSNLVFMNAC